MMDGPMPLANADLTDQNRKIVQAFYQRVFIDRQLDALAPFVAPDLIQHHPEVDNGINGLQTYLRRNPAELSRSKIHRLIAEGDFVVVQSEGTLTHQPTLFYDIFRLAQGKIVEHWGVSQQLL
jgi:predicted SnoaL-like aldol condensation-catalyzing enzyme